MKVAQRAYRGRYSIPRRHATDVEPEASGQGGGRGSVGKNPQSQGTKASLLRLRTGFVSQV